MGTDCILTRRLQHEPDLPGGAMVIFDQFHERRREADRAWRSHWMRGADGARSYGCW